MTEIKYEEVEIAKIVKTGKNLMRIDISPDADLFSLYGFLNGYVKIMEQKIFEGFEEHKNKKQ